MEENLFLLSHIVTFVSSRDIIFAYMAWLLFWNVEFPFLALPLDIRPNIPPFSFVCAESMRKLLPEDY